MALNDAFLEMGELIADGTVSLEDGTAALYAFAEGEIASKEEAIALALGLDMIQFRLDNLPTEKVIKIRMELERWKQIRIRARIFTLKLSRRWIWKNSSMRSAANLGKCRKKRLCYLTWLSAGER